AIHISRSIIKLCRQLVARALDVKPESVHIKHCALSPSNLFIKTNGSSQGSSFFAETYLVDVYPAQPRLEMPWEEEVAWNATARPIEEHIKVEWNMAGVLHELAGSREVAHRIGMSLDGQTIVWEEAPGIRVDKLIERSRWGDPKGRSLAPAM